MALLGQAEAVDTTGRPAAFIVVDGAPLSHRMIGLVALGIPTVLTSGTRVALLDLANWVDVADFFAIGCNDLMQCLLGSLCRQRHRPCRIPGNMKS